MIGYKVKKLLLVQQLLFLSFFIPLISDSCKLLLVIIQRIYMLTLLYEVF